jgi:hypothetical protein
VIAATAASRTADPTRERVPTNARWTRWRVARLPATRLYPGSGRLSATAPKISNPAVAAAREQTSPAADAAIGPSAALVGSSPRLASERRCGARSCALSCDDGASAFVRRESVTEQAADQSRGCERQMPAPTRAPTCRAMLQRASRRICACWGASRLTVCRIGSCCDNSVARFLDVNLNGCWDFPETRPTSNHDGPSRRSSAAKGCSRGGTTGRNGTSVLPPPTFAGSAALGRRAGWRRSAAVTRAVGWALVSGCRWGRSASRNHLQHIVLGS